MKKRVKKTEAIFKLCLMVFFLMLMWMSRSYPDKSRLFPQILGAVTVLFIIISFIQDFLGPKEEEKMMEAKEPPPSDVREETLRRLREVEAHAEDAGYEELEASLKKKRLTQGVVIILISLVIGYLGGFLLIVPFYFICFGILHGDRKKAFRYVAIAVSVTVVTYFSFTWLMGIPLLRGVLWD
jgi:Tripartite tricarboxylate transporter TctB family